MVWQRAGTVSVQAGSTTVVGANVDFAASSRVGDSFIGPDGVNYEVANVASATVISILPAYKGPTASGAAYAIMPVQGYDKMLSDAFNALNNQFGAKLAALGTTGNYDTLPLNKGGTGATDQAGARSALGLGNAATSTLVTSTSDTTSGRSLTVGYGGIGALNNAEYVGVGIGPEYFRTGGTVTGKFYIVGVSTVLLEGSLTTFAGNSSSSGSQMFFSWDNGEQYFRAMTSGTWRAWRKTYTDANTTRAADGTLKAI
ncbi:pyocin knob domain-containing protein [Pseudomonas sp. TH32]|uniref:pyocin knob domain-containing protein n=1 Tax=Pseudomonas sp. TH32 TaxID=2796397 RepID=UPI001F5C0490|nr:pyocin knob domain-containing protein [Pseudomonas sp. TH32]